MLIYHKDLLSNSYFTGYECGLLRWKKEILIFHAYVQLAKKNLTTFKVSSSHLVCVE